MGLTPRFSLPYPELTDDANVPADMGDLANAVDGVMLGTTLVDARGDIIAGSAPDTPGRLAVGPDGSLLTADSSQPLGLKWVSIAGAYIPVGIVDNKGDLIVGAGNDQPVRFAAGPDGQVLTTDSNAPQGLKWAAPTGGGAGGGIDPAIIDAKGDLIAGSAPDTPARLALGTDGYVLTADSSQPLGLRWGLGGGGGGGQLLAIRRLTASSGSYTPTAGTTRIYVEAIAAGGAGGGNPATTAGNWGGGGGGGGNYAASLLTSGFSGVPYAVGQPGGGVAGQNGGNGGDSVFGANLVVAKGGAGGAAGQSNVSVAGGNGGDLTTSVGDVRLPGQPGTLGNNNVSTWGSGGGTGGNSGGGYGYGGYSGQGVAGATGSIAGRAGGAYGGGGGGAITSAGTFGAVAGGAGAVGIILVWEFA